MRLSLDGPLVSVDAVAAALDDPALRLVDCRWYLGRPGDGRVPALTELTLDGYGYRWLRVPG